MQMCYLPTITRWAKLRNGYFDLIATLKSRKRNLDPLTC